MKNIFSPFLLSLLTAGTIFSGCGSSAKKTENTTQNTTDARLKPILVSIDSSSDYAKTKIAWSGQIEKNEAILADYKVQVAKKRKNDRAKFEAVLDQLQKRNADMKVKMEEFKENGKEKWEDFKTDFDNGFDEFNNDMADFGKSLADLVKKDKK